MKAKINANKDLVRAIKVYSKNNCLNITSTCKANYENITHLQVTILNPQFIKYVYEVWLKNSGRYPSTGFLGVMLAIHICDEVIFLIKLIKPVLLTPFAKYTFKSEFPCV